MTAPFAAFEMIRVINLAARTDRRAETQRELDRVGLGGDPRVGFIEAIAPTGTANWRQIGEHGVFMSHLLVLREAAECGQSVLILEDDADFTTALATAAPVDADIYYGGSEAADPADLSSSDIIGAHCMGFSAAVVRRLVPYLTGLIEHPSPPPIDGAYVWFRRAHPEVVTQFAEPPVAVQRSSRSDIAPGRFDRIARLRPAVAAARRLKRALARGELSFGLREAILMAVIGCAAATYYAWRHPL